MHTNVNGWQKLPYKLRTLLPLKYSFKSAFSASICAFSAFVVGFIFLLSSSILLKSSCCSLSDKFGLFTACKKLICCVVTLDNSGATFLASPFSEVSFFVSTVSAFVFSLSVSLGFFSPFSAFLNSSKDSKLVPNSAYPTRTAFKTSRVVRANRKRYQTGCFGGGGGGLFVPGGGGGGGGGSGGGRSVRGVDFGLGLGYKPESNNKASQATKKMDISNRGVAVDALKVGMMARFKSSFVAASSGEAVATDFSSATTQQLGQNPGHHGRNVVGVGYGNGKGLTLSGFVSGGSIGGGMSQQGQTRGPPTSSSSANAGNTTNTNVTASDQERPRNRRRPSGWDR